MARDWAALTRQIKEANDIVAVINGYLPLQPAGPDVYKGVCPFHNDHRPSMQVSVRFQNFRCWACGKKGDVINFVEEFEKVPFIEARAILARRANIALEQDDAESMARLRQLEAVRWAAEQYQQCLLDSTLAETARTYLGERGILGETVRRFGLGFAPAAGEWLVGRLSQSSVPLEVFEQVGLVARSNSGSGHYDRFRDRIMFPVRNAQGQTVGFGGRVLPSSPLAERGPKYYNSAETPLFSKSELLYGLDQARHAAAAAGCLVVVEGYTDVLMAHQSGVANVVATMGTALNARHVRQLRRYVPKVVLVFDADEGGSTGVDRALAIFAEHDIELQIASLPDGLDPCDLLIQRGAQAFAHVIDAAVDALEFKLNQLLEREAGSGVEGQRRVIDEVLNVIARVPDDSTQSMMKRDLMMTRLGHRLGVRADTLRTRLNELRRQRRDRDSPADEPEPVRTAAAPAHEPQLLQLLLANPKMVSAAFAQIPVTELSHPGLRQLLAGLYDLHRAGETPDLDALRPRIDNPALMRWALNEQDIGRQSTAEPDVWFNQIVRVFAERRDAVEKERLKSELTAVADDHARAVELLRKLQSKAVGSDHETATMGQTAAAVGHPQQRVAVTGSIPPDSVPTTPPADEFEPRE